ncbi:carbohydrate binding domain-containing protein [Gorillibacterium massiliense]|uniref:carbohydrate binding domain-containing protein n=1 Tax=Gorillibacterium massiliense TaxID=1280390 RepID=UPI0004BC2BC9|nr:carbohydrate binding domain-containing protein [Gorillibacterium massiliense]
MKHRWLCGICIAAVLGILVSSTWFGTGRAEAADELIANGGFESGLWSEKSGTIVLDGSEHHGGTQSAKITGAATEGYIASTPLAINPNETYRLSVWIKSDLASSDPSISVNVLPINGSNTALPWYPNGDATKKIIQTGGKQNWTRYTVTLKGDMNTSAAKVKIYLRVSAGASGTVWFDDVSLVSANLLSNPGFESGSAWRLHTAGTDVVSNVEHNGSYSTALTGGSSEAYVASNVFAVSPKETYRLTIWLKTQNVTTSNGVSVNVLQIDANNSAINWITKTGSDKKLISAGGSQDWTRYEITLSGFTANTASLAVYVRSDGGISGLAWVDDATVSIKYRDNFFWGVTGHPNRTAAYPGAQIPDTLDKINGLGAQIYRIEQSPYLSGAGWNYTDLDNAVNQAYAKGLKLYLVLNEYFTLADADLKQMAHDVADRYKGKISYYQIDNEPDDATIYKPSGYDGSSPAHYDPAKYDPLLPKWKAISEGLRDGDPNAKRVINIGYLHTGFLDKVLSDGLQWDVNALDWYSDMDSNGDMVTVLKDIQDNYPQNELLVAELDTRNGTQTLTEQQQADYIQAKANEAYYSSLLPEIRGFFVYELLDEDTLAGTEAYYGLVHDSYDKVTHVNTIGSNKIAYGVFQSLIAAKY